MQHLQLNSTLQGGKYRIEKVLGQGGFGITYLAYSVNMNSYVAIKEFFLKDLCAREERTNNVTTHVDNMTIERFKAKFLKEARTLMSLIHRNIVHVYDCFEENNTAYYVMEYIEGPSLSEILRMCGKLDEPTALDYIHKVATALFYIHGMNINHLDVKPGNILLRKRDNEIVLIDFGTAKHYDTNTGGATTMTNAGYSQGYAAIEQYRQGGVSTFTPETDIYSLGAMLYKMLTGQTPPEPSLIIENGLPTMPSWISQGTKSAITAAMQISKADRPHSISDFLNILYRDEATKVVGERTVVLTTPHTGLDTSSVEKRHSPNTSNKENGGALWGWMVAALIMAVIGVVWYNSQSAPSPTTNTSNNPTTISGKLETRESSSQKENISKIVQTQTAEEALDEYVKSLPKAAKILGKNRRKVYYCTGTTNNYTLYVYDAVQKRSKIIDYENISKEDYLYIYSIVDTRVVNNHLYVLTTTGACGSGYENSIFFINMDEDQIYFVGAGDNARFIGNDKVKYTEKIVTNYDTAKGTYDYNYEYIEQVKTLR